jgi:hypothetical protein
MRIRLAAVLVLLAGFAWAGDPEFDRLVREVESHYGTHATHVPLMGVANLFVKIARPGGATSLRMALFEELKTPPEAWADLDRFMNSLPGELRPVVTVNSRRDGEATYILMGPAGKSTKVLVATFERHEATLIEVRLNLKQLARSLEDPEHAGLILRGGQE